MAFSGRTKYPDKFDTNQDQRTIDTTTFKVHLPLQNDGMWTCTKVGNLTTFENTAHRYSHEFPVILSPGEGAIIHHDLIREIPMDGREPITQWRGGTRFPVPTREDLGKELTILGEITLPVFMEDMWTSKWTSFKVKALVTNSELPLLLLNYTRCVRPLMWIGVGEDKEKSLLRRRQSISESGSRRELGYAAIRDDGISASMF
jgi:hypothetical protein